MKSDRWDETVQGKTGQHQEMNRQFSPCVELTVSPQTKMRTPLSRPKYFRLEPDGRRVEPNEYLYLLGETNAPVNSQRK